MTELLAILAVRLSCSLRQLDLAERLAFSMGALTWKVELAIRKRDSQLRDSKRLQFVRGQD